MEKRPEQAARENVDPDRLLPGEDGESVFLEDANHWVLVYQELLQTKVRLLAELTAQMHGISDAARQELGTTDLVTLHAESDRLQSRLTFWLGRQQTLQEQPR